MTYRRRLVFPALVTAGVLWGTTVPLSKLALAWLAPGWLAFARFALAGALLMVVGRSRLRAAASPAILITGAAGYGGSVLLQNLGIERTSVTHAALLIGATPVLVAVLAAILGHGIARPLSWLGCGLSLVGVIVIAGGQGAGSSLTGDGLVLASQLACAGFVVAQARLLRGRDPVAVTALQLMAAAIAVLPAALAGGPMMVAAAHPVAVIATAGLVLAGTVLPTTLFAFAQGRVSADVAGAFLNLEPLFGAAIGFVLFGNALGPTQVVGGVAVVAGIGLSSYQVVRAERARQPRQAGSLTVANGAMEPAAVTGAVRATATVCSEMARTAAAVRPGPRPGPAAAGRAGASTRAAARHVGLAAERVGAAAAGPQLRSAMQPARRSRHGAVVPREVGRPPQHARPAAVVVPRAAGWPPPHGQPAVAVVPREVGRPPQHGRPAAAAGPREVGRTRQASRTRDVGQHADVGRAGRGGRGPIPLAIGPR
jgi:O-acetylserine/cysteine efflux transporter